ncbi:hypothetical protein AXFE_08260 [Acidithrix ferrooxidans]|uniref:Uncharacterized protein n=1 Tax=Acidithrix ferrooxidans TaxID=1280514 RepID=A0A0D8HMH2_9ACTN|nr:hypothetical protein AXFE_08260 [Acidithrix ferrooxidans]
MAVKGKILDFALKILEFPMGLSGLGYLVLLMFTYYKSLPNKECGLSGHYICTIRSNYLNACGSVSLRCKR